MWILALALAVAQDDAVAKDKEAAAAVEKFRATFDQSKDNAARVAAVAEVARVQHARVLKVLAPCLGAGEPEVRRAAAQALGGWSALKADIARALVAATTVPSNMKDPPTLGAMLEAIAANAEKSTAPAVLRWLDDSHIPVTVGALRAAATVRTREMVDPLIKMLQWVEERVQYAGESDTYKLVKAQHPLVLAALKSITRQAFTKYIDWWTWWKDNKSTFKVEE